MIDHNGVLIHVDPQGDRIGNADLKFEGWVAANQSIKAIWLAAEPGRPLPTCDRPDVRRVLPGRIALGFSGTSKGADLVPTGLRLRVQTGDEIFEVDHPLPPSLPEQPLRERIGNACTLAFLTLRERLATDAIKRWSYTLRRHLRYRRQRSNLFRRPHTDALLADFAVTIPQATFLQIGANDGLTGDPLHGLLVHAGRRWRGVLVEPVPHLFAQLAERYTGNSGLRLEQAAIGEQDGAVVIHRLETKPTDPVWFQELPSLNLEVIQRSARLSGITEPEIIAETVPCLSVTTLLARHQIIQLDLLVIDTEGWDWRILRQFDLATLRPKLILYEHQHLSPEESEEAHQYLAHYQYDWAETPEGDTIAWKLA